MSTTSKIEWTDKTWNPIRGCSLVSAGCANCYAMKQAHRFSGEGQPYEGLTEIGPHGPRWTGKITLVPDALDEPLRWRKPCRVFVNSMSDLFHEAVPEEFIRKVFAVMALAPRHTFQILTKRPDRMRLFLADPLRSASVLGQAWTMLGKLPKYAHDNIAARPWPLPNVWLGVSIEDQATADERIPPLLQTPAAVRFISAEPLLGPVDLTGCLTKEFYAGPLKPAKAICGTDYRTARLLASLNWVIVGGESGAGARFCDIADIRSIVQQCQQASVPVFVKQLGSEPRGWCVGRAHGVEPESSYDAHHCDLYEASEIQKPCTGRCGELVDRKGGDMAEWPADLRVREFPR